jgi:hypothetical protein
MKMFAAPSNLAIFFVAIMRVLPARVGDRIFALLGGERIRFAQRTAELSEKVARELVSQKNVALSQGTSNKDILSLCIKANSQQSSRGKMTEKEMLSQLQ